MHARALLWTGALVALAAPLHAEDGAARAAALFREGRAAMERYDLVTACPKFAESARLDPAPGTILNLALCEEGLGHLGRAVTHYRVAIAMLPRNDERVPFAKQHVRALEPRVAQLTLVLPEDAPEGARVMRDGEEIAREDLGVAGAVDPGRHEVTLRIPGQDDARFTVSLHKGEHHTLVLWQSDETVAGTPTEATTGDVSRRTLGFVVGGVGAASLAAGLVTGALVLDKKATVDASCHGTSMCDTQEGVDAASSGATLSLISTITFLTGVAALGVGAFLVVTSDDGRTETTLAPALTPAFAGLCLGRTF